MAGCKIFKISDGNMIGLALIMDVIKAGSAILINLSHCQRVEIVEARSRTTTESPPSAGGPLADTQHKGSLVATLYS